jgi:hypothetical protein
MSRFPKSAQYGGIKIFHHRQTTITSGSVNLNNIVRVVKSRRMRWAGHVARMGEERGVHKVLVGEN